MSCRIVDLMIQDLLIHSGISLGPFIWPHETGLALLTCALKWFQNILKPV